MPNNDLLDFNMYEQSLSFMGQKGTGTYSTEQTPAPKVESLTVTENGDYSAADQGLDGFSTVSVNVSGGGVIPNNPVKFYDYDGTVVYSYTAEDFLALTEMPANPTHEGLTAQGWNWSLANAKDYVSTFGNLIVGQMYITDDSKTRIRLYNSEYGSYFVLGLKANGTSTIVVNWGDGSDSEEYTATDDWFSGEYLTHTYESDGYFTITVEVTDGNIYIGTSSGNSIFKEVNIGSNVSGIGFYGCTGLYSLTIPQGTDIYLPYDEGGELGNISVPVLIIPKGITALHGIIDYRNSVFYNNCVVKSIVLPDSITEFIGQGIFDCSALSELTMPNGVEVFFGDTFGGTAFITLNIPNSVELIDTTAIMSGTLNEVVVDNVKGAIHDDDGEEWPHGYLDCKVTWLREE